MKRNEHLKWAKDRAIKIAEVDCSGIGAWTSFMSDMQKHDELKDHMAIAMGVGLLAINGFEKNETIKFIEGFN